MISLVFLGIHFSQGLLPANAASSSTTFHKNYLVILVDRVDLVKPDLRNIWLVLTTSPGQSITFLPVFSSSQTTQGTTAELLENTFALSENGSPDDSFLNELEKLEIHWSNYLVIDDVVIAQAVDLSGGVDSYGQKILKQDVLNGDLYSRQYNVEFEKIQKNLLIQLCQELPIFSLHPDYEDFLLTFLTHSRSSFTLDEITYAFRLINENNSSLQCQFPTLESISNRNKIKNNSQEAQK
jgi:hypothetical protein